MRTELDYIAEKDYAVTEARQQGLAEGRQEGLVEGKARMQKEDIAGGASYFPGCSFGHQGITNHSIIVLATISSFGICSQYHFYLVLGDADIESKKHQLRIE